MFLKTFYLVFKNIDNIHSLQARVTEINISNILITV